MADIALDAQSVPVTPSSGAGVVFVDSTVKRLSFIDDTGKAYSFGLSNFSTAAQSPAATTRTYIAGSALPIPSAKLRVGTCFRWTFSVTKTAAGTAASTIDIAVGTAGTTADAACVSFTKPAGTAVADEGTVVINAVVRSIGAGGVMVGQFNMTHNLAATGHMTIPCACVNAVSAGFDTTVPNLIVGLCVTSGASDAITIQLVQAEAWNV